MIRAQKLRAEKLKVECVKEGSGGGGDLPAAMADAVHEWLLDSSRPLPAVLSSHPRKIPFSATGEIPCSLVSLCLYA